MIVNKKIPNPSQIREVLKDDFGFLWLMVTSKVYRFDGRNCVAFPFDEVCVNIVKDEDGIIWTATRQGIFRYNNDYSGFEELKQYTATDYKYRRLLAGPGNKLYLLSADGITRWNKHSKKFEPFGIEPFLSSGSFAFLKHAGNKLFYKQDDSTLARYDVVTGQKESVHVFDPNYVVPLNEDTVWAREFIGNSVLVSFVSKTTTRINTDQFDTAPASNNYFVTGGIKRAPGDYLFLFNNIGCYSYNVASGRFKPVNFFYDGLLLDAKPLPIINNFYQEQNGMAWIANEDGLVYFNPAVNKVNLVSSNGAWDNDVRNFAEDGDGNIWFGTAHGFCRWDKKKGTIRSWVPNFESKNYLNYSSIRTIASVRDNILIGQSEKGFWIFNPTSGQFRRPIVSVDSLQGLFERDFNHNMVRLRNNDYLLLSNRLWYFNHLTLKASPVTIPDSVGSFRSGYEDNSGRIWLIGRRGFVVLDKTLHVVISKSERDRGKWLNSIVQINDSTFWVTAKYIYQFTLKENQMSPLSPLFPELRDVHFSHLFRDSLERIWMCGETGIYRYLPSNGVVEKFDQYDNVKDFSVSISNSFRASDGTAYFGSMKGFNYFVPEKIPLQNDSLLVKLINVTVNHDDSTFLQSGGLRRLSYDQNSFVFDFVAPYIYNADKIQYRYKLEGTDQDWVLLGNNSSCRFTALPPGNYRFIASASLNGKDWFELKQPFGFHISPPFWKTWWFFVSFISVLVMLGIFLFRRRIALIKTKAAVQQQLMSLEIRALRSQMNPHFIFNSLNAIAQLVASRQNDKGLEYLSKFSKLLRLVLDESENSFIPLKDEIRILDLYLQLESLRFGSSFTYSIKVDDLIDEEETLLPSFLIHPIIENAIWHGLLHKEGDRRLIINFSRKGIDKLLCVVKDNGIGIEAAALKKQQHLNGEKQESKGLKMVKERLSLLEEQHHTAAAFMMEDLKDENGLISGTRCTLEIPVVYE